MGTLIEFFSNTTNNTCNILINNLFIGVYIKKALIIISFDEIYGDITISFTENDWEELNLPDEERSMFILDKLNEIKNKVNYTSILFGYDPADDEDMQLIKIET